MHDFDRCLGIEILESLYKKSLELKEVFTLTQNKLPSLKSKFEVYHNDFLEFDWWSEADFVMANSTCYDMALMRKIGEKASLMKKGAWMVTLTKKLPNADILQCRDIGLLDWECLLSLKMTMSWGYATVNVQRKIK